MAFRGTAQTAFRETLKKFHRIDNFVLQVGSDDVWGRT